MAGNCESMTDRQTDRQTLRQKETETHTETETLGRKGLETREWRGTASR